MPLTSILILAGIVAAFMIFGIVLAWGEYQTRHLRSDGKPGRSSIPTASNDDRLKMAAKPWNTRETSKAA